MNEETRQHLPCEADLFEELGTINHAVMQARDWLIPRLRHGGLNHAIG